MCCPTPQAELAYNLQSKVCFRSIEFYCVCNLPWYNFCKTDIYEKLAIPNCHLSLPGNITLNEGDIFNHGLHRNSLSSLAMNVTCTGRYDNKNTYDDKGIPQHIPSHQREMDWYSLNCCYGLLVSIMQQIAGVVWCGRYWLMAVKSYKCYKRLCFKTYRETSYTSCLSAFHHIGEAMPLPLSKKKGWIILIEQSSTLLWLVAVISRQRVMPLSFALFLKLVLSLFYCLY